MPKFGKPKAPGTQKVLRWVGYSAFFIVTFLLFAYWSFPYYRLRDWIVQEVEYPRGPGGQRQPSGWELEIVELSPSWLTGVELTGVQVVKLPEDPGEQPASVTIESAGARVSPWSLFGSTSGSFWMQIAGGEIEGEIDHSEEQTSVQASFSGVDLRRLQILRSFVGLPIAGTLDGTVDLTLAEQIKNTTGKVHLDVGGLKIGDDNAKLKLEGMGDGLTVDTMDAGDLAVRINVKEGVARIDELAAKGPDAELEGSGTIRLLKPAKMSRLDLLIRVKFTEKYRNKSDRTRALFSLMEFNPKLRAARTKDDALQWRITGSFGGRIQSSAAGRAKAPGGR